MFAELFRIYGQCNILQLVYRKRRQKFITQTVKHTLMSASITFKDTYFSLFNVLTFFKLLSPTTFTSVADAVNVLTCRMMTYIVVRVVIAL